MKTEKIKKRIVVLPKDFQEVLITHEMIFEKQEINIDIIRKLVYLYSVKIILTLVRDGVLRLSE
jgi:hypothetical protein